jgi:SAM-dependent methyltransferase
MDKNIFLNAGCGQTRIPDAVGTDIKMIPDYVDIIHDLNKIPYPFKENCFDEIHLYHVLEHLDIPIEVVEELNRLLKTNGILYIRVPHFSSMGAFSDITHKRPFGYSSFDCFDEFHPYHFYTDAKFLIIRKKIKYHPYFPNSGIYEKYVHNNNCLMILRPIVLLFNFLISLSPLFFERIWCYLIGGATEIEVELKKSL